MLRAKTFGMCKNLSELIILSGDVFTRIPPIINIGKSFNTISTRPKIAFPPIPKSIIVNVLPTINKIRNVASCLINCFKEKVKVRNIDIPIII